MKLSSASLAVVGALAVGVVGAFQPALLQTKRTTATIPSTQFSTATTSSLYSSTLDQDTTEGSICDIPSNVQVPEDFTAAGLRSAVLTDADGNIVRLGEKMGSGTSVVIFLRHLG